MKVISIPVRLRWAIAALFLSVPIAALETVLVTRAPSWQLPYQTIAIWSMAVLFICAPLAAWLASGKRWALRLTTVFAGVWCLLSAWVAVRMRYPSLGFYTLFIAWYFGGLIVWLRHEIGRSYFDPQLMWYQGIPKPIPSLKCDLVLGDRTSGFKVSRIDKEGAFIFSSDDQARIALPVPSKAELVFHFRDRHVRCQAVPMRLLTKGMGAGFQFQGLSPDLRKELGDFVETLRGEGYVQ